MSANFPHHVSHGDAVRGVTAESQVPSTGIVRRIMNFLEGVFALAILLLTLFGCAEFFARHFFFFGGGITELPELRGRLIMLEMWEQPGFYLLTMVKGFGGLLCISGVGFLFGLATGSFWRGIRVACYVFFGVIFLPYIGACIALIVGLIFGLFAPVWETYICAMERTFFPSRFTDESDRHRCY